MDVQHATEREDDDREFKDSDKPNSRGHNETTAMGLKGEGTLVMNHPGDSKFENNDLAKDASHDEDRNGFEKKINKLNDSDEESDEEEEVKK